MNFRNAASRVRVRRQGQVLVTGSLTALTQAAFASIVSRPALRDVTRARDLPWCRPLQRRCGLREPYTSTLGTFSIAVAMAFTVTSP
jgi:hypothetical protein